jgi:hypothetical protein
VAGLIGHLQPGPAEKIQGNPIGQGKPVVLAAEQQPCLHGIEQFLNIQVWQEHAGFPLTTTTRKRADFNNKIAYQKSGLFYKKKNNLKNRGSCKMLYCASTGLS